MSSTPSMGSATSGKARGGAMRDTHLPISELMRRGWTSETLFIHHMEQEHARGRLSERTMEEMLTDRREIIWRLVRIGVPSDEVASRLNLLQRPSLGPQRWSPCLVVRNLPGRDVAVPGRSCEAITTTPSKEEEDTQQKGPSTVKVEEEGKDLKDDDPASPKPQDDDPASSKAQDDDPASPGPQVQVQQSPRSHPDDAKQSSRTTRKKRARVWEGRKGAVYMSPPQQNSSTKSDADKGAKRKKKASKEVCMDASNPTSPQ